MSSVVVRCCELSADLNRNPKARTIPAMMTSAIRPSLAAPLFSSITPSQQLNRMDWHMRAAAALRSAVRSPHEWSALHQPSDEFASSSRATDPPPFEPANPNRRVRFGQIARTPFRLLGTLPYFGRKRFEHCILCDTRLEFTASICGRVVSMHSRSNNNHLNRKQSEFYVRL